MSNITPSADPTVHIPTTWDKPTIMWRNQDSSVVGIYATPSGITVTGSASATLSAQRFYTSNKLPLVDQELASRWYVDTMSASLSGSSFTASFAVADWSASSTYYYLNLNHELGSDALVLDIFDTTFPKPTQVFAEDIRTIDINNLELRVAKTPDQRFDGVAVIGGSGGGSGGYSGFSGYSGAAGGGSGFSGYSGIGTSGFSGYSGIGTSGFSGYSGNDGTSGTSGFSGYSGVGTSGFSGYSGNDGTSGTSGFSGYSGVGTSGFSGYSGIDGTSGASGFSGYSGIGTSGFSGYSGAASTGGSASITVGTKDTVLSLTASTVTGAMLYATDTSEFIVSDGSNWRSSGPLFGLRANKDMGIYQDSGIIGYGHDYITDKTLYNVALGGNADPKNGAIRVNTAVTPNLLEIYLRGAWYVIQYDISYANNDFRHAPISYQIKAWKGDSVLLGMNGRPIVSEYQASMGPNPVPRAINGGTF